MTFNDNKIKLPRVITIKLKDEIKIRCLMKKEPLLFHIMLKTRDYMVNFGLRHTGDYMKIILQKTVTDNIDNYPDGLYSQTRMQFLAWAPQVPSTNRNCGSGVKVKMMRGIHILRRDQTTQVISCNPWSLRLYPYQSLIRKLKTYLELEVKLVTQPQLHSHTSTYLPDKSPLP